MSKPIVINHVEISGEKFDMDKLSEEKHRQLSELWQERIMSLAG